MSANLHLVNHRGTLSLQGDEVNLIAKKWLSFVPVDAREARWRRDLKTDFHVTILNPSELKCCQNTRIDGIISLFDEEQKTIKVHDIGVGKRKCNNDEVWFVVIRCVWVDNVRHSIGLVAKQLHITLGLRGHDLHGDDISKGCQSIYNWANIDELTTSCDDLFNSTYNQHDLNCLEDIIIIRKVSTAIIEQYYNINEVPQDVIKRLKRYSESVIKYSEAVDIIENIGFFLFRYGYLFGLKLLATVSAREHSLSYPENLFGIAMHVISNLPKKIQTVNSNARIFNYGEDVVEDYLVYQSEKITFRKINRSLFTPKTKYVTVIGMKRFERELQMFKLPRNFTDVVYPKSFLTEYRPTLQSSLHKYMLSGRRVIFPS